MKRKHLIFSVLIAAIFIYVFSLNVFAQGTTYYVSPNGNDLNDGTSIEQAWKSLEKVNSVKFYPGDSILFEAGGIWDGQLRPQGSGTEDARITLASYGEGNKPLINGNGVSGVKYGAAIALYNQPYWTIKDFEVTNLAPETEEEQTWEEKWRCGVLVYAENKAVSGVEILNLTVHDVNGYIGGLGGQDNHWNGGIVARGYSNGAGGTRFVGLRIENCEVYNVARTGITSCMNFGNIGDKTNGWMSEGLVIRNNVVHHIAGDGIIVSGDNGGLVEHNVAYETNIGYNGKQIGVNVGIWGIHSNNTVFQYNESYLTRTTNDGMGYDIDGMCKNITMQYNYSHDNEGGFMLMVNIDNDGKHTVRYNISQNDHRWAIASFGTHTRKVSAKIYNNTIYTDPHVKQHPLGTTEDLGEVYFYNNIFCNLGGWDYMRVDEGIWDNNAYFGYDAERVARRDANAIVGDPKLVAPGSGSIGRDTVDGYKLFEDSPLLGAGRVIEDNGGLDYWGNPVDKKKKPNVGAYNGEGIPYTDKAMTDKAKEMSVVFEINSDSFTKRGETKKLDSISGAASYVENGVTMVPIRFFSEAIGAEIMLDYDKRLAALVYCGVKHEFIPGNNKASRYGSYNTSSWGEPAFYPEGEALELSISPVIKDSVLYVPLRDIAENMGKVVLWNNGSIIITDNPRIYKGE